VSLELREAIGIASCVQTCRQAITFFSGLCVDEYTGERMGTLSTHPYPETRRKPLKSMTWSARSCPRCGSGRLDELGQSSVKNATSILRCRVCSHVWMLRNTALPVVAEGAASSPRESASRDDQRDDEGLPGHGSLNLIRRIWQQVLFRCFDPDKTSR
jgi:hypothetical protein